MRLYSHLSRIIYKRTLLQKMNYNHHRGWQSLTLMKNTVTLTHNRHIEHAFLVKTKERSKPKRPILTKKFSLDLLHQILGHFFTRSLLSGYTVNVWKDIKFKVYADPFCTSCQISTIKKILDKIHTLNPKTSFKWVFMVIISATSPKSFKKYTTFATLTLNYGWLYQTTKTLCNGKHNHQGTHGQATFVSI